MRKAELESQLESSESPCDEFVLVHNCGNKLITQVLPSRNTTKTDTTLQKTTCTVYERHVYV